MNEPRNITGAVQQEGPPRPLPHLLSDAPLPFGKLVLGAEHYREFVCSKQTATWLQAGGMTHIDGKKVQLQIKDRCRGGHNVIVGFWTEDQP